MDKNQPAPISQSKLQAKAFSAVEPIFTVPFWMLSVIDKLENHFHFITEALYRHWPRKQPTPARLRSCRIVSHRGEHDNRSRFENTIDAFTAAADAGVWGVELDVRWTRDLVPVVFHDANTLRLYQKDVYIASITLDVLKKKFPVVPTLEEVIDHFGGRHHLMIEIKDEPYAAPCIQSRRMLDLLSGMTPGDDFHLMSLHPGLFDYFDRLPKRTFIPIARVRVDRFSRMAVARRWGGLAGHFLALSNAVRDRHQHRGQGIGTGFADSKNCLYREVNREVDWIFSNRAATMQTICSGYPPQNRAGRPRQ